MSKLIDRAWQNRCVPLAVLAVSILFVALGGLNPLLAFVCTVAALVWAMSWPSAPREGIARAVIPSSAPGAAGPQSAVLPISLIDGLPDAAVLLDSRGVLIAGNSAARAVSPVPLGRPLSQWMRVPELLAAAEKAGGSGAQERCQIRLFTPVERLLDVLVIPISTANEESGRPSLLVTLRDLTEQEQLSRMRADFVANASHELRTPLASLRGFIETLQGAAKDDPAARARFLGIMQAQAERMSRLIEDLLSLSRIEMREHVTPTATVDLVAVTSDVIATLRPAAEKAGIKLIADFPAGLFAVIGDKDELAQVTQNLIQNAIKYGRAGGRVDVAIRPEGGQIALAIVDDGIGIAQEHLPRLTERFYRVSAKESKERGGTGLGLAIVKHIVNRHRGELRISSMLGKGSTFEVLLPAKRGSA